MNSNFIQQLSEYKIDNSELEKNSSHSDYVNAKRNAKRDTSTIDNTFDEIYFIACIPLFLVLIVIFLFYLIIKLIIDSENTSKTFFPVIIFFYIITLLGLLFFSYENNHYETFIAFLALILTPFIYLILWLFLNRVKEKFKKIQNRKIDKKDYREYLKLQKQVDSFNTTIDKIIALSNSKSAKHKLPAEAEILEILELVRGDLICALNLEKIKRNNPNYKGVNFVHSSFNSKDDYLGIINQINMQTGEINELLTNWQDIRTIIEDLINGDD